MQVVSLFQDSRGYIWVGTKEGLNCFNGEKFTSFTDKDGLADDYILHITEDVEKKIWVSTGRGLACYDGNKIIAYPNDDVHFPVIAPAPDGKIWYFGEGRQHKVTFGYFVDGNYVSPMAYFPNLKFDGLMDIAYSQKDSSVLVINAHSAYEVKGKSMRELLSTTDTIFMIKPASGELLIASMHQKVNFKIYEYQAGKLVEAATIWNERLIGKNHLKNPITFSLDAARLPIYTLTPDTLQVGHYHGLQKNNFLNDRDNQLWLGSEDGLYQIYSSGFETFKKEYFPQVWSIAQDFNGNIWFASFNFGLKKFDGTTITEFPNLWNSKIARYYHFHPSIDKRGTLYFPNGLGILVYDGKSFRSIKSSPPCLTSYYDKERDLLWAGFLKKAEIYDRNLNLKRTVSEADGMEIKTYIVAIGKDQQGLYWLGSFSGLTRYNWDTGRLTNYNSRNKKLPANGVVSIFNDTRGRTWFGSTDGLLWYDNTKDSIRKIECEQLAGAVSFVTAIDSSWLVVSQPAGIYLMDLQAFYKQDKVILHLFNEKNGFSGIEPGQDGAFVDSKGQVWMTTSTEVVKLDPQKIKLNNNTLNIRISEFNGIRLPFGENQVRLPQNERTAVLTFDAICFNRPFPVQYSWKIEGRDWSPWQEENYAVITSLPQGSSMVQVRAKVLGLPLSDFAYETISLQANIALWKQEWFFPVLLGLVSLLVIIALIMLYQAKARMTIINRQARTFQLQAILSQMNPHFIFNLLASLQTMILSANIEKANDYLVKMANLIRGFLDASVSTSQSQSANPEESELPLTKELEILKSYIEFQQLIYPEKFEAKIVVDPAIEIEKQTIPPMLIQPFVENAIRHGLLQKSGKGALEINITYPEKNVLFIEISDNGIGIQRAGEMVRKSRFLYTSRGKELTINRIKLLNEMGYNIQTDTQSTDSGTIVTIKLRKNEP
jgi:ligand-binding sensor domain-containing protein/two-component sensor histidine kinase